MFNFDLEKHDSFDKIQNFLNQQYKNCLKVLVQLLIYYDSPTFLVCENNRN